jgi:hypothetical protein
MHTLRQFLKFWKLILHYCIFSGSRTYFCGGLAEDGSSIQECIIRGTKPVFKEKHGVWDPMPELTMTHLIS